IKRGPVGLIGNTKSDAKETTEMLINDWETGQLTTADNRDPNAIFDLLKQRGIPVTTWDGWHALDAAERELGQAEGRERKKIVEWNDMLHHAVLAPVSF
ncbi:ferredoxin/ferredoxin-NADP reductase, partial [Corynebacterium diphtheriae]